MEPNSSAETHATMEGGGRGGSCCESLGKGFVAEVVVESSGNYKSLVEGELQIPLLLVIEADDGDVEIAGGQPERGVLRQSGRLECSVGETGWRRRRRRRITSCPPT